MWRPNFPSGVVTRIAEDELTRLIGIYHLPKACLNMLKKQFQVPVSLSPTFPDVTIWMRQVTSCFLGNDLGLGLAAFRALDPERRSGPQYFLLAFRKVVETKELFLDGFLVRSKSLPTVD